MRYWTAKNSYVVQETPLHPQKINVWCDIHVGGVIGPNFFMLPVTVNGDRYRAMLEDCFFPELDELDIDDM